MKGKPRRALLLLLCLMASLCLGACSQNHSAAYDKAIKLFANGEYAEAAEAFDKLGQYAQAATYAAYSHGLVFYEQGQYAAAAPYFEVCQDFMYGRDRYSFCHAFALEAEGSYAEAAECFAAMEDFEDAELHCQYCRARAAEDRKDYATALYAYEAAIPLNDSEERLYNLRGQVYNKAISCRQEGDYESAIILFTMLGDYLSSADQAVLCKDEQRENQYMQADDLADEGQLQEAYDLFSNLTGYRDAASRAEELAERLGIDTDN